MENYDKFKPETIIPDEQDDTFRDIGEKPHQETEDSTHPHLNDVQETTYHDVTLDLRHDFNLGHTAKDSYKDRIVNFLQKLKPTLPKINFRNFTQKFNFFDSDKFVVSKKSLFILFGGFALMIGAIAGFIYFSLSARQTQVAATPSRIVDNRIQLANPRAEQAINQDFTFPLNDQSGKAVASIKYSLQNVQEQDEILVKGQKATAIKGKTFLVVNLKLANDFAKPVQIQSKDYIRLTVGDSPDQLAPDMHNDPILVQASSTKLTRVGFTVDDTAKNMKLFIGEINGKKTPIDIHF